MNSVIFGKDSVFLHELSGKMKIYVFLMRNSSWNNSTICGDFLQCECGKQVEYYYLYICSCLITKLLYNKEYPLSCFGIAFALKWEIGLN